jgi:hypothetical protein
MTTKKECIRAHRAQLYQMPQVTPMACFEREGETYEGSTMSTVPSSSGWRAIWTLYNRVHEETDGTKKVSIKCETKPHAPMFLHKTHIATNHHSAIMSMKSSMQAPAIAPAVLGDQPTDQRLLPMVKGEQMIDVFTSLGPCSYPPSSARAPLISEVRTTLSRKSMIIVREDEICKQA